MTATNHALTGTAIGLIVGEPLLALPLALLSHYALDVIPHFGLGDEAVFKTGGFKIYLLTEAIVCFLIVLGVFIFRPENWLLAVTCAFLAAAPDLLSINRFQKVNAGKVWQAGWYTSFAKHIQWFERPIGAVVEVAWAAAMIIIILPYIS